VARGSSAKPVFERVQIDGAAAAQQLISLQPGAGGALLGSAAAKAADGSAAAAAGKRSKNDVTVVGADNAGEAVLLRAAADSRKRGLPEADAAAAAAAELGGGDEDDEEEEAFEETLGQRVAALERSAGGGGVDGAAEEEGAGPSGAALPAGPIKADSLGVLLTQALRSGDRALLERCVGVSDTRVVNNTVRRLLPADAAAFLRAAVERLQSKPARGGQLAAWIRAVLVHHTAYLMASPGVQAVLTSLYQTIESRLAMQRTLLSLSGRLDLLMVQARARAAAAAGAAAEEDGEEGPLAVFQEPSSDEEVEVEDPFAAGADSEDDFGSDLMGSDEDEDMGSGSGEESSEEEDDS
jgi:U3 small nucleolar RNA-associated protein 5